MNPAFVTITTFHSWTRVTVIFTLTLWPSRLRHVRTFNLTAARCDKTNLKVKVGDFPGMEVVDPLQDLFDELSGLLLAQRLLLRQEVKQLPPGDPATQTHSITGTIHLYLLALRFIYLLLCYSYLSITHLLHRHLFTTAFLHLLLPAQHSPQLYKLLYLFIYYSSAVHIFTHMLQNTFKYTKISSISIWPLTHAIYVFS